MSLYSVYSLSILLTFSVLLSGSYVMGNPIAYGNGYNNNNNNNNNGGSNNGGFGTGITWGYSGCCFGFPDLSSQGSGASPFYGGNDAFNFAGVLFGNNGGNGHNNGGYGGSSYGNQNGLSGGSGIGLGLGWYDNLRNLINRGGGNEAAASYGSNSHY